MSARQFMSVQAAMQMTTPAPIDRLNVLLASSPSPNPSARNPTRGAKSASGLGSGPKLDPGLDAVLAALAPLTLATPPILADTAVRVAHVEAFWVWFKRDVAPDIAVNIEARAVVPDQTALGALRPDAAKIADAASYALDSARESGHLGRLAVQVGGDEIISILPFMATALRNVEFIVKAGAFGRAINTLDAQPPVEQAVKALSFADPQLRRIWTLAAFRSIANPRQFFDALVAIAGGGHQSHLEGAGQLHWINAAIIDVQRQVLILEKRMGLYADIDLACRAIARFDAISRAIGLCLDLSPDSRWMSALSTLTRQASSAIDPLLSDVGRDVVQCMRPPRDGADRLAPDQVLTALNGMHLLAAVRNCRESLALNSTFERIWSDVGKGLELLLGRAVDAYRDADPVNQVPRKRLDAGILIARLRFGDEYARILERSRESIKKRKIG
jgi:hypothetical protein